MYIELTRATCIPDVPWLPVINMYNYMYVQAYFGLLY